MFSVLPAMGSSGRVRVGRGVLMLLLLLVGLLVCVYWQLPYLLHRLVAGALADQGIELHQFEARRPTASRWRIEQLQLSNAGVRLDLQSMDVGYVLSDLLRGELAAVAIGRLLLSYTPVESDPLRDPQESPPPTLPDRLDPGYWLAQLPWQRLTVAHLQLSAPAAEWQLAGQLTQERRSIASTLVTGTPAQFAGQRLDLTYSEDAGLRFRLRDPDDATPVSLTSRFAARSMDLQLQANVQGDLAALLAQSVGMPELRLNARLSARSRVPWPLPDDFGLTSLSVLGQIDLDLERRPDVALAGLGGLFSLREGLLEWTVDSGTTRVTDAGSALLVECRLLEPVLLQARLGRLELSDGLSCEASNGGDQLVLDLRSLDYVQPQVGAAEEGASLALELGYALSIRDAPLRGSAAIAVRQVASDQVEGRGVIRLNTPLLSAAENRGAHEVPFVLGYWPDSARAVFDAQLRLPLADRLLTTLQLAEAGELDIGKAQLEASVLIRWQPEQFTATLDGALRQLQVYTDPGLPVLRPLAATFSAQLADDALRTTGQLQAGTLALPFTASSNLSSGAGTAAVEISQSVKGAVLNTLFAQWQEPVELTGGQLDGAVNLRWDSSGGSRLQGTITLDNGTLRYDDLVATGIHTTVALDFDEDTFSAVGQPLEIARLDAPVPVASIRSSFHLTDSDSSRRLQLGATSAQLLGGQASLETASVDLQTLDSRFQVVLTGLSLAEVLALEGDDISGTGLLDGRLPVQLEDGALGIANGSIAARAPGGQIRVGADFTAPTGQPGLDFALQALADFRYSTLSAGVDYAPDGELLLAIKLRGNNPAVEQGRAIHYNLNVTENIPSLLESLQADALLTEQIQDKVERKVNR